MKLVLIGAKASGKSTLGRELSEKLGMRSVETDDLIEARYNNEHGTSLKCSGIYDLLGDDGFRSLEEAAVAETCGLDGHIIITGGSTFTSPESRRCLRGNAVILYCRCAVEHLLKRLGESIKYAPGLSKAVFLEWYKKDIAKKDELYGMFADIVIDTGGRTPAQLADEAYDLVNRELAVRVQAPNTCGELVRLTTFGESHGPAVGAVLDGVPSGIALTAEDIQKELDRRKPGQSSITTPRAESDKVHVLSGVFEGKTTGSPIGLVIYNKDSDSSKYDALKDLFRPGHADYTFFHKFLVRDHRGGGRSSGRETAARVAGGAVAKKILEERGVRLFAHTLEVAGICAERTDYGQIEQNVLRCADPDKAPAMLAAVEKVREAHDSIGGIVRLDVTGLPPGLGDPVFAKIDARLTYAVMTLGAVKGVEVGDGFECARATGSTNNDQMKDGTFVTNHAGGVLGGITTGAPLLMNVAVKPTPSIVQDQKTVTKDGENTEVSVKGRHDPCILPRIIPVIESMAALVLLDAWALQSRLNPAWAEKYPVR